MGEVVTVRCVRVFQFLVTCEIKSESLRVYSPESFMKYCGCYTADDASPSSGNVGDSAHEDILVAVSD